MRWTPALNNSQRDKRKCDASLSKRQRWSGRERCLSRVHGAGSARFLSPVYARYGAGDGSCQHLWQTETEQNCSNPQPLPVTIPRSSAYEGGFSNGLFCWLYPKGQQQPASAGPRVSSRAVARRAELPLVFSEELPGIRHPPA